MVLATPLSSFPDKLYSVQHAGFLACWSQCGAKIYLELDETLDTSSAPLFRQQLAGVASQSVSPILETRGNPTSADGHPEFHLPTSSPDP